MDRGLRATFGSLIILFLAALATLPARADPIRIGIIGDQTASTDLDASYQVLQQGVMTLQAQSLNGVLHVGDMVESTQTPAQITARFNQAIGILNGLGVPWYLTPGDHDVDPPAFVPNSPDRSREVLFQSLYQTVNPLVRSNLYYSFNIVAGTDKYHFICLDALEHLDTDPRWGDVFFAGLSAAQQQWLQIDLDANRDATAIVAWLHQPLWYNWSTWKPVHSLLAQYHVSAVIAGHFHYNQTEGAIDGIDYRVVGATGGMVKNATPYAGGVQHVTVMTLSGPQVSYQLLPLGSSEPTSFTPRYDMDRVTATSYILDSLYGFWSTNPVWLQNGNPVTSCGSSQPAALNLSEAGNAIDSPQTLQVEFTSNVARIASANYNMAVCDPASPPGECILAANANVSLSNTSLAEINSYSPSTIWNATLGGTGAVNGGQATLTASYSYVSPYSNLPLGISSSQTTQVQVCPTAVVDVHGQSVQKMLQRLATESQWIPAAGKVVKYAQQIEISGGPGLGRIAVRPADVKLEGGRALVRVGAQAKVLSPPTGAASTIASPPQGATCQHYACLGSGIPNAPGTLICCDTGQIIGRCMGAWPCSGSASAQDQKK